MMFDDLPPDDILDEPETECGKETGKCFKPPFRMVDREGGHFIVYDADGRVVKSSEGIHPKFIAWDKRSWEILIEQKLYQQKGVC